MKKLPKPKLVFWLRRLRTLGCVVVLLVAVPTCYLTNVLLGSILTITKTVGGGGVDQICIGSRDTNYCLTQSSIAMIFSGSSRISTRGLSGYSCQGSGLIVSQLGFFFFMRLRVFFFFWAYGLFNSKHLFFG